MHPWQRVSITNYWMWIWTKVPHESLTVLQAPQRMRTTWTLVLNVMFTKLGSQDFNHQIFGSEGNTLGCINVAWTISNLRIPTSTSLPYWLSLDNLESVHSPSLLCDITIVEIYWLKGKSFWLLYVVCHILCARNQGLPCWNVISM